MTYCLCSLSCCICWFLNLSYSDWDRIKSCFCGKNNSIRKLSDGIMWSFYNYILRLFCRCYNCSDNICLVSLLKIEHIIQSYYTTVKRHGPNTIHWNILLTRMKYAFEHSTVTCLTFWDQNFDCQHYKTISNRMKTTKLFIPGEQINTLWYREYDMSMCVLSMTVYIWMLSVKQQIAVEVDKMIDPFLWREMLYYTCIYLYLYVYIKL